MMSRRVFSSPGNQRDRSTRSRQVFTRFFGLELRFIFTPPLSSPSLAVVPLLIVPFFTEDRANHSESGMQSAVQLVPFQMIHIASGREILTGGGEKQQMTSLTSLKRKHIGRVTIIHIIIIHTTHMYNGEPMWSLVATWYWSETTHDDAARIH